MIKFRAYKYISYNKHKILKALFLIVVILLTIVPVIYLVNIFFPQGKSMTFTLEYDSSLDSNFTTIDYSGIENKIFLKSYQEYYLDGQLFTTDSSGIIDMFFNNYNEHNLTIYFGGETYEYIFNSSNSETITLACKSLDATVMWEDINVTIEGTSITLQYFDGLAWINIETGVSDVNGLVSFTGLVMGDYRIDTVEFTIEQPIIIYTIDIFEEAIKTIIDIDYLNTIFGLNYVVDLSTIEWDVGLYGATENWLSLTGYPNYYDGMISDDATGIITIYNLDNPEAWIFRIDNYGGEAWIDFALIEGLNQINLDAKSLSAEFLWSGDSIPVVETDFELFFNNGVEWISLGIFTTDVSGIISVDLLPIGAYKFDEMEEFSIIANDVIKTVVSTVESLCVKKSFSLGFHRDMEFKFFFFVIIFNYLFGEVDKNTKWSI